MRRLEPGRSLRRGEPSGVACLPSFPEDCRPLTLLPFSRQTGGQDDLVTVYAPLEQHIVAHCQGHSSWVTGVAWDASRSEERTLRIASVGEDCKLILWDLSSASLTRPKAHVSLTLLLATGP